MRKTTPAPFAQDLEKLNDLLERHINSRKAELTVLNREIDTARRVVSLELEEARALLDLLAAHLRGQGPEGAAAAASDALREDADTRLLHRRIDRLGHLLEAGRGRIAREERVDLSTIARGIAAELEAAMPECSVFSIAGEIAADCDRHLLRIALQILLSNAWRFTAGRGRIEIGAMPSEGNPIYFVRDNGIGFDERQADCGFPRVDQLRPDELLERSCFGLATVQRIVQRHGGRLWAEGSLGAGATIFFTLGGIA